jgi:transcriptional regulator with XRE-family HTH domain
MQVTSARHFIREWRKHRGLTLERLAEELGITHASLSRVERGLQPYNQALLENLATALDVRPADLLIRDPSDPDGLWSIYDQLRPVERRQVVEIAKTLKRTGTDG